MCHLKLTDQEQGSNLPAELCAVILCSYVKRTDTCVVVRQYTPLTNLKDNFWNKKLLILENVFFPNIAADM